MLLLTSAFLTVEHIIKKILKNFYREGSAVNFSNCSYSERANGPGPSALKVPMYDRLISVRECIFTFGCCTLCVCACKCMCVYVWECVLCCVVCVCMSVCVRIISFLSVVWVCGGGICALLYGVWTPYVLNQHIKE